MVPELIVDDLTASVAFYALLGFRVAYERRAAERFVYLTLRDGVQLMLEQADTGDRLYPRAALEHPYWSSPSPTRTGICCAPPRTSAPAGSIGDSPNPTALCGVWLSTTVDGLNRDTASVTGPLLCWPSQRPASGSVSLRAFEPRDAEMAVEMSEDPYLPLIGSLPAHADADAALAWVHRQRSRTSEGVGFSFCVADRDDRAVGSAGLWTHGFWQGRATAGYAIRPSARGRGLAAQALRALTSFAFTLPLLHRVELYIEPDNHASRQVAERAAYVLEGTLRQHQEIGGWRRDMCLYAALPDDKD